MFQPITSLDDLMSRVTAAYPTWTEEWRLGLIRRDYNEKRYGDIYWDQLNTSHGLDYISSYEMESRFEDEEILAALDEDENIIPEKFAELVAIAKVRVADHALKPLRKQLADDFRQTFDVSR